MYPVYFTVVLVDFSVFCGRLLPQWPNKSSSGPKWIHLWSMIKFSFFFSRNLKHLNVASTSQILWPKSTSQPTRRPRMQRFHAISQIVLCVLFHRFCTGSRCSEMFPEFLGCNIPSVGFCLQTGSHHLPWGEEKWGEGTEDPAHALAAVDLQSTDEETAAAVMALSCDYCRTMLSPREDVQ